MARFCIDATNGDAWPHSAGNGRNANACYVYRAVRAGGSLPRLVVPSVMNAEHHDQIVPGAPGVCAMNSAHGGSESDFAAQGPEKLERREQ